MLRLLVIFLILPIYMFAQDTTTIKIFGDKIYESDANKQANIIIYNYEEIQALKPKDIYDLLEKIPGIDIKKYDFKNTTINIGGYVGDKAGLNNVVMINGRKITNPDMANPDLSFLSVDNIDRIEVYIGGGAVLFGDRATGGAINIVTKKPVRNSVNIKMKGGSYGTYDSYIEGVLASENYSFIINGNKFGTQGYRDNSEFYAGTINTEFSYFTDRFEITLDGKYSDQKYGLPGPLTESEINQYGRKYTKKPNDGGHDYNWSTGLKISYDTIKYGKIILDGEYRERYRDYYLWGSNSEDNLTAKLFSPQYQFIIKSKNYENTLQVGAELESYKLKTHSSWSSNDIERNIISYYFNDYIKFHDLFFNIGYRYADLNDDYNNGSSKDMSSSAYNIILGYNINSNNTIYIKTDKSFRFPTTDEINEFGGLNTSITKQETYSYEIGYKAFYKKYSFGTTLLRQLSNDEIFTNPTGVPAYNTNFDTEKTILNIDGQFDDKKLLVKVSYNFIDSKLTEDGYDNKDVPLVSKHNVKSTIGYRLKNGLGFYYYFSYYSSFYQGNDYKNEAKKMDGYGLSDLKLEFVKKNYELFIKVNNIFNKKYNDYVYYTSYNGEANYYPSPTRNLLGGITVKF
ncbi:MAG: TonB-dependent receptor [Deferribacterales bacterium]